MCKKCRCCHKVYTEIPEQALITNMGVWIRCECDDGMIIPLKKIRELLKASQSAVERIKK